VLVVNSLLAAWEKNLRILSPLGASSALRSPFRLIDVGQLVEHRPVAQGGPRFEMLPKGIAGYCGRPVFALTCKQVHL